MCPSYRIRQNCQFKPMQHVHHAKHHSKKTVLFSTHHKVHFYVSSSPQSDHVNILFNHSRKDPLPKERRMQQLVSRRAVLSFQRHLREIHKEEEQNGQARLSEISNKFSRRAKEVALETARNNYLEVHDASHTRPRFSPESCYIKADDPVQISTFPAIKLTRKIPLARRNPSGSLCHNHK